MSKAPKLRFKEFSGDWEKSTLNDIANITMGQSPIGESYNSYGEGIGLINGPVEFTDKYPVVVQYTIKPTKYCYKDDILFCVRGSSIGRINISDDTYCIGRGVAAINAKEGKSTTNYIYSLLQSKLDTLLNFSNGSTFPNISSEEIKKYSVKVPSLEEQDKIASFFFLIDDKTSLQSEKVEALKDYKKGMMQKIFSRELRFKDDEGRDYPEWEEKKLGDIGTFSSGGSLSKNDLSENGEKCILYGDLFTEYTEVINDVCNYTNKKEKLVYGEYNTLLFPTSTTVDARSLICPSALMIKEKVILGGDMSIFKPNTDNVICSFLSYQINGFLKNQFSKRAQGSTIIHIYSSDLKTCKVLLPCIEEQLKITECLYSLDNKINKEQEKLDSLKQYKKGLLQQMFI